MGLNVMEWNEISLHYLQPHHLNWEPLTMDFDIHVCEHVCVHAHISDQNRCRYWGLTVFIASTSVKLSYWLEMSGSYFGDWGKVPSEPF